MAIESKSTFIINNKAEDMVKWLSSFGLSPDGGVNRLLYSSAWGEAQKALEHKMKNDGLAVHFDSVGNLFGRLEGSEAKADTVLTGSHIDTVADGGRYDGVYGIVASLLAVERLKATYGTPKKPIEVVSLCEEEGSRFPMTFWGSRNITGRYTLKDAKNVTDAKGVPLLSAMREAGFDPAYYQSPMRQDIDCFIELHIEQGIVLDRSGRSLGLVSHIVGQRRFTINISGESNHAGTTPMPLRKDAMSIASHLIDYVTTEARNDESDLVATVGKITAQPNTPNVIAGEVEFTLDVRHHEEKHLKQFCDRFHDYIQLTASENQVSISSSQWLNASPVQMDASLMDLSKATAQDNNIPFQPLISGAGHDAQVFGTHCPTALLFVPSQQGISHSPKEFTKAEDLENGVDLLTDLLYKLAY
ncbi:allantoate deiminase [Halobacillus campisalis]|uniref:Allantoate deiminase n=1 Tax=Halobacillus campisalis TaxID=435909 RepID=A0ABW2K902_9BACI|nr:allantoate deiminase [Halobacillus campisalis]